ncbi:unnamed protein product [Ceutorhynchus assimilis]|uniref:Uncharacterized protein n=1 Tax=Ceutorhynchus assimilis TaxID=467358 RepID=A0A9N9QEN8_9CUCU|nr:unnamed protein product [Ceutorhynchus assimilis]
MYSDQCGGQNRNIKVALLCNNIVSDPSNPIEVIDHKFLLSGHSYLPCDEDFGLVKKQQKFHPDIFVPNDWKKVVRDAKKSKKFEIVDMTSTEFYSTVVLEKNITNRKILVDGVKVEWFKLQWLRYCKTEPFKIFYKYSNNEIVAFQKVDISKRNTKQILQLELLYPNGNAAKKKDLLALLPTNDSSNTP